MDLDKAVALVSGGLDSATAAAMYVKGKIEVHGLFVDYGQRAVEMEWAAIQKLAPVIGLTTLCRESLSLFKTILPEHSLMVKGMSLVQDDALGIRPYEIPFRNGVLISMGIAYAQCIAAGRVMYGGVGGDGVRVCNDDTDEFLEAMQVLGFLGDYACIVGSPVFRRNKSEIVRRAKYLKVPMEDCWSCFSEGPEPCGVCRRCLEFKKLGLWKESHAV